MFSLKDLVFKPKYYVKIFFLSTNKGVLRTTSELTVEEAIVIVKFNKEAEVNVHIYANNFLKYFGSNIVDHCTGKGEKIVNFLETYL